ncbi:hypothetical protein ACLKMH_06120 [Psychromonas sp. KJ10-10]|uniref:hypothetical protein n=1 Tax=Psychromonas sp. KJ10-10 TaxID=3391823 RepID=UPI0039B37DBB
MTKLSISAVNESFNNMTLRERYIIFVAVLICCASVMFFWVIDPATIKQAKLEIALQKSFSDEKTIKKEIAEVELRLKQDPLQDINKKIAFSEASLSQLDQQLAEKLVKFIRAQKMPIALTQVLANTPGVKISGLKSLPVKLFQTNDNKQLPEESEQDVFYQHTLEVSLVGDYNAIYQYLLNVESLQDKFYWYSMDYKVSEYPLAEVTLQIYTLSDQQELVSG